MRLKTIGMKEMSRDLGVYIYFHTKMTTTDEGLHRNICIYTSEGYKDFTKYLPYI